MNTCINCNKNELIYLGKATHPLSSTTMGPYHYVCNECGERMWSSEKDKSKYKWYKMKTRVKELLVGGEAK